MNPDHIFPIMAVSIVIALYGLLIFACHRDDEDEDE